MTDGHLCHKSCVCSEPLYDQPAPPEEGLRERLRSTAEATIFAACDGWCDRPSQIAYEAAGQVADALLPVVESYVQQRVAALTAELAEARSLFDQAARLASERATALADAEARLAEVERVHAEFHRDYGDAINDVADRLGKALYGPDWRAALDGTGQQEGTSDE